MNFSQSEATYLLDHRPQLSWNHNANLIMVGAMWWSTYFRVTLYLTLLFHYVSDNGCITARKMRGKLSVYGTTCHWLVSRADAHLPLLFFSTKIPLSESSSSKAKGLIRNEDRRAGALLSQVAFDIAKIFWLENTHWFVYAPQSNNVLMVLSPCWEEVGGVR